MTMGAWSFAGAMALLAIVSLAMAQRKFRDVEARVFAELDSLSEQEPPQLTAANNSWYVPAEQAEDIVRTIAERYQARRILQQLGNIPAAKLANAIDCFAYTIHEEETPLALLDSSFLQNGKAGLLLTNARLYSSRLKQPIGLEEIDEVALLRPDMVDRASLLLMVPLVAVCQPVGLLALLGLYQTRGDRWANPLVVNGQVVHAGRGCSTDFWPEVLQALAAEVRQTEGMPAPPSDEPHTTQTDIMANRPMPGLE